MIKSATTPYRILARRTLSLSSPFNEGNPSGHSGVRSGFGSMPLRLISLALDAVPHGGAK
eukprot:12420764-Karenia_brevis.AAC.1